MGNVGRHYYDWRYNNAGMPSTPPTPEPDPEWSIPANINGTISPGYATAGTVLIVSVSGFQRNEQISFWLAGPNGVYGPLRR